MIDHLETSELNTPDEREEIPFLQTPFSRQSQQAETLELILIETRRTNDLLAKITEMFRLEG